jgi:hypothetical protein
MESIGLKQKHLNITVTCIVIWHHYLGALEVDGQWWWKSMEIRSILIVIFKMMAYFRIQRDKKCCKISVKCALSCFSWYDSILNNSLFSTWNFIKKIEAYFLPIFDCLIKAIKAAKFFLTFDVLFSADLNSASQHYKITIGLITIINLVFKLYDISIITVLKNGPWAFWMVRSAIILRQ